MNSQKQTLQLLTLESNFMKTITQLEYFGSKFINGLCEKATINVYKEKILEKSRICLVKKSNNFGIDIFFKSGKLKTFIDFKSFEEAEKQYNKIINKN